MLITTAINYTNGDPHIGHCYEGILTDFLVRYYRAFGKTVFFQTGTDEHGQKIASKAESQGMTPQALCDRYAAKFADLASLLQLSHDHFIRTTDPDHVKEVQRIFLLLQEQGDIYLDTYEGWYNVREETFVTDLEAGLNNYKDPVSGVELTRLSEPSYFFRLTKYLPAILEYIENTPNFIVPDSRRQEIIVRLRAILDEGEQNQNKARDLSISRTTFDWGITVPSDPKHCLYVWMDALLNYWTGPLARLGSEEALLESRNMIHVIGKDILWFHAVIWPALLMALGKPLPRTIWTHDFVSASDGKKMSKSLGNVVEPFSVLEKHGVAQTRFYLLKETSLGLDLRFNEEHLEIATRTQLAAKLGNLVNRVLNIAKRYAGSKVPQEAARTDPYVFDAEGLVSKVYSYLQEYRVSQIVESVQEAIHIVNQDIVTTEIWTLAKREDPLSDATLKLIACLVRSYLESLAIIAKLWVPINPRIAESIFSALGLKSNSPSHLIVEKRFWKELRPGAELYPKLILFPIERNEKVKK